MRYFMTKQKDIVDALKINAVYKETEVMRDLPRIQIPGELFIPSSQDHLETSSTSSSDTDSLGEIDSELSSHCEHVKTTSREKFEKFFKSFFKVLQNKEIISEDHIIPYTQGMITGSLAEQLLINASLEKDKSGEELRQCRQNTTLVNFCVEADNGTWQGVSLNLNLKDKSWYAVITDFSTSRGDVAIIREGNEYLILKEKLSPKEPQEKSKSRWKKTPEQDKLRTFIKNEHLKTAIFQLPMKVNVAKFLKKNQKNTYESCIANFLQIYHLSEYASHLKEKNANKLENPNAELEAAKPSRSFFKRQ